MKLDIKQLKELMSYMEKTDVAKVTVKEDQYELCLERFGYGMPANLGNSMMSVSENLQKEMNSRERMEDATSKAAAPLPMQLAVEEKGSYIPSPMVGIFYQSSSPKDPPFIKVGDRVEENTIVCIIEAMKVMNEVKAGKKGVVAEICVENGHAVEFGSKLFRIE